MVLELLRRLPRPRVRPLVHRFLYVLDSEGVVFFQSLVYLHLAAGGAYCAFVAGEVPEALRDALGPKVDTAWLWLCIGATLCLVGKLLSTDRWPYWVRTSGLYLQLAGDAAAFGAFAGYVTSTVQDSPWGKALIAVWVFAALAECAFFLCWRDIRRIVQAEKVMRR
ncbi:MAG: hypothetical protein JHC55_00735 [Mycolicibacterium sp.]|nr:hypothetical protein [Mycolicibacterium sp.]